jgi:hypothetical protein
MRVTWNAATKSCRVSCPCCGAFVERTPYPGESAVMMIMHEHDCRVMDDIEQLGLMVN